MLRGRHVLLSASVLMLGLGSIAKTSAAATPDWQNGVLKIEVVRNDGKKDLGSGVLISPERLLTNCHVLRNARDITVFQGKASWPASPDAGDTFRDLCVLKLPGFPGEPATIAEPGKAKVGNRVSAVGFSGGKFKVTTGRIKGLFTCACDGGKVIQTSAQFDPGASGGGLFDADGELIGILTFKAQSGGMFHFAIPIGWMKALSALPPSDVPDQGPFWVNPSTSNGYFLAACDLSAKKKWRDLSRLAQEWVREDRYNPQAWMALGRANLGLKRPREAAGDFKKVLELDPAHAEALWELQQLELELGESLLE
jgi:hypothetical protein